METPDLLFNDNSNDGNESDESETMENPPNSPEFNIIRIPREVETEHVMVNKFFVDGKMLCYHCCWEYCQENGKEYCDSFFLHCVVRIDEANEMYRFENCDNCSIGMLRMFGRRNCPTCHCDACSRSPEGRCGQCENNHLTFVSSTRRRRASSL